MCIRDRFEVKRAEAIAAQHAAGAAGTVPPAVLAAGAAANATPAHEVDTEDLLGGATTVHDFAAWTDGRPPDRTQVDVHSERDGGDTNVNVNVTTRRGQTLAPDIHASDEDKISVAGSVSDVTPPPGAGAHPNPQLNPFTPEWFAQLVGAAANAAATAAATACLLYTSPSPRDLSTSRMPSSA